MILSKDLINLGYHWQRTDNDTSKNLIRQAPLMGLWEFDPAVIFLNVLCP